MSLNSFSSFAYVSNSPGKRISLELELCEQRIDFIVSVVITIVLLICNTAKADVT